MFSRNGLRRGWLGRKYRICDRTSAELMIKSTCLREPAMRLTDEEIDRKARHLLAQHGLQAAIVAAEQLNRCIDQRDWISRDAWARIVHRIHERQHSV